MADNLELIRAEVRKAIDSGILTSGGKLNDELVQEYLDFVVDLSSWKSFARFVGVKGHTWKVPKIGVGRRVSVPKEEAKDPAVRRRVTTGEVKLSPAEVVTPFSITDRFYEETVQGLGIGQRIMRMMADQSANDDEGLFWEGNTLGPAVTEDSLLEGGSSTLVRTDSYLAQFNGWLKQARSGAILDAGGVNVGVALFKDAIKTMPLKFRRNKANLRWLLPSNLLEDWREKIASRATDAGDRAISGEMIMRILGIQALEVPNLPMNQTVVEHFTVANDADIKTLLHKNIESGLEVVTLSTLGSTAITKFVKDTDYTIDYTLGKINKIAGGAIADGATIKITYLAPPQFLLTYANNPIVAYGRNGEEMRVERDRNIFTGEDEFVQGRKIACSFEETDAVVLVTNVAEG